LLRSGWGDAVTCRGRGCVQSGRTAMPKAKRSLNKYASSLFLLAAAACLWPVAASAQPPDPTASDANYNTAAGTNALLVVTGEFNTAIGHSALSANTAGNSNTASGYAALVSNTTGEANTASGRNALFHNTTGNYNTASGVEALEVNTTGSFNTAAGFTALYNNTSGGLNTASGYEALYNNTIGGYNTASGVDALFANTTGSNNIALGFRALQNNQTGNNNVAVGTAAMARLKGSANIALGFNAGRNTTSGSSNIYVGNPGIAGSESRVTRIGSTQRKVFIAGIAGVPASGANVVVRANGQLGVVASSARYKQDITPLNDMAGKLAQLRPVSYRYKAEPQATHYGLIAEEVAATMPELVVRDDQNRPESVQYLELVPLLLQQWKAQQVEIVQQRELNGRLRARLDRDEAEVATLRRTLATRLATIDGRN
jgi:hypothetical protein